MYCDLIYTGKTFNGKKVYRCDKCGLEAGLDDPEAKIYCFEKNMEAFKAEYAQRETAAELQNNSTVDTQQIVEDQKQKIEEANAQMASQEEIEQRMKICNECEYYKEEACMLCGCRVVREKNYQNKLANKKATCPDGRWGVIN